MNGTKNHYLKSELYQLFSSEPAVFEFLQDGSLDGLWYWDLDNPEHEWMNPKFWTLLGFDPNQKKHLASEWQEIINQDDLKRALANFEKHCKDPSHPYDQIVRYRHKNGSTVWVRCRGVAIRDESGKPIRMLGAHNDLTALKQAEAALIQKNKELEKLAWLDPLTSLYNRRAFLDMLKTESFKSARLQTPLSIAVIDIDNFKSINDNWGHQEGDDVLCAVSRILLAAARQSDTIARLAGDEFIIMMSNTHAAESKTAAERYRATIESALEQTGTTVSIGLTTTGPFPAKPTEQDIHEMSRVLVATVDKALYLAKDHGKNQIHHCELTSAIIK
ncbi:sensor domain-containing diguanylate cyclase [Photobacterium atrarenae]|uniref:diguanylate cyclase n=1 Tax=Photobacterium atrarenae TaxID=865757 RepID=A0ABY5GLA0_9GAMM|nr:sensor domain-containing diguanylate cyclase [Photobacterium atrarenae]UTV29561.1 sensor domain-containing diguanylate cyclase [Photobacterium atrarenae]